MDCVLSSVRRVSRYHPAALPFLPSLRSVTVCREKTRLCTLHVEHPRPARRAVTPVIVGLVTGMPGTDTQPGPVTAARCVVHVFPRPFRDPGSRHRFADGPLARPIRPLLFLLTCFTFMCRSGCCVLYGDAVGGRCCGRVWEACNGTFARLDANHGCGGCCKWYRLDGDDESGHWGGSIVMDFGNVGTVMRSAVLLELLAD